MTQLLALTGRMETYLESPENGTMPHSCTIEVYRNNLPESLTFTSQALRGGSGVKLILDNFEPQPPIQTKWFFHLSPNHADYNKITDDQRKYLVEQGVSDAVWIHVQDAMEINSESDRTYHRNVSIEESWDCFITCLKSGHTVIVDLSELRPAGTVNSRGLTATGPVGDFQQFGEGSFLDIYIAIAEHLQSGDIVSLIKLYGRLNETLRRGGLYKNGIVTSSIRTDHRCIHEYLDAPLSDIPGSHKKGVTLVPGLLEDIELADKVCEKHNYESVFLQKLQEGDLYPNVCVGIILRNHATCLIGRENLGMVRKLQDIVTGMEEVTLKVCEVHVSWREEVNARFPGKADIYAPLELDRQIAVDVIGLANLLASFDVPYGQFVLALEAFLDEDESKALQVKPEARDIVFYLAQGYRKSVYVADKFMEERGLPKLERIHTIEPSQASAFRYQDTKGYTTCRNIDPPFDRRVRRTSETMGSQFYYHGPVEVAKSVGAKLHLRHWEAWMRLMQVCGRPHAMSFDNWEYIDRQWLKRFMEESPLQTVYYNFRSQLDQWYITKSAPTAVEEGASCDPVKKGECLACAE